MYVCIYIYIYTQNYLLLSLNYIKNINNCTLIISFFLHCFYFYCNIKYKIIKPKISLEKIK